MPAATEIITFDLWWLLMQNISTKYQGSSSTLRGSRLLTKWDLSMKFADVSVLK